MVMLQYIDFESKVDLLKYGIDYFVYMFFCINLICKIKKKFSLLRIFKDDSSAYYQ